MNEKKPEPKAGILDITAYTPGKSIAPSGVKGIKLSSNENPLGPGRKAREALAEVRISLKEYPDGSVRILREAIAKNYGLDPKNIICGNGSDDLLSMIAGAYLAPGDEAVHTEHGFLYYPVIIRAAGAIPVAARETDCTANVDAILSCISERTKVVFLANPNNPTGTYLSGESIRHLHATLPKDVILALDAAYAEYVQQKDYETGVELVSNNNNVIMTRTFSKIHGLAALRIGWAYAPNHIIDVLNRIRGPFNVNAFASAAAAAAIGDSSHTRYSVAHNNQWLPWVREELKKIGLTTTPSVGNFVLVHFPGNERSADAANTFLSSNGYLLRAVNEYGLPDALRMTIGMEKENRGVIELLAKFMKGNAS